MIKKSVALRLWGYVASGLWSVVCDCGTQSGQWGTLAKHLSNGLLNTNLVLFIVK